MGNVYINCEKHGEAQDVEFIGKAGEHLTVCAKCFADYPKKYVNKLPYSEQLKWNMSEQDRRATASPYLYVLQVQKKVYANDFDNPDGIEYYDDNLCSSFTSKEEAQLHYEEGEHEYNQKDVEKKMGELKKCEYKFYWEDVNWFFTKEALDAHVRCNRHNYGKTRDYVKYCYRNPEMEYVQKLLRGEIDVSINKEPL